MEKLTVDKPRWSRANAASPKVRLVLASERGSHDAREAETRDASSKGPRVSLVLAKVAGVHGASAARLATAVIRTIPPQSARDLPPELAGLKRVIEAILVDASTDVKGQNLALRGVRGRQPES